MTAFRIQAKFMVTLESGVNMVNFTDNFNENLTDLTAFLPRIRGKIRVFSSKFGSLEVSEGREMTCGFSKTGPLTLREGAILLQTPLCTGATSFYRTFAVSGADIGQKTFRTILKTAQVR